MTAPTFLPPAAPHHGRAPRPATSGVRIHAGIALGVIGVVGSVGSLIAFFLVAFLGDGCGFADSPPVCTTPGAAWALMLGPGLVTLIAGVLALVGVVVGGGPRAHGWPVAAWIVWLGGGAGWVILMAVFGAR